jgi:hypothetical protein
MRPKPTKVGTTSVFTAGVLTHTPPMHAAPAPVREWPVASPERHRTGPAPLDGGHAVLRVDCVGYLVPTLEFDALVHSVFARACNIACGERLLTIVTHGLGDGPTTLRLAPAAASDLRLLISAGDRWHCRYGTFVTPSLALDLTHAAVWRRAPPSARIAAPVSGARLRFAANRLAEWRLSHSSIIDREGDGVITELREACRRLDVDATAQYVARLVGWGEGLTPAGDDFLVGLSAALRAQIGGRADRALFLLELSAAMTAQAHLTTPIAAHFLRLAAQGHFNADVVHLVDALLGARGSPDLAPALSAALESGATSGADTVTGIVAGLAAWLDVDVGSNGCPIDEVETSALQ